MKKVKLSTETKEPITVEEKQDNGLWSMTATERFSFLTYMCDLLTNNLRYACE
ncbi:hypothetical protein HanXRQr2_Chr03g0134381 [Helianthus annuus]|uniref:Uncharacterized protein n=1 Tax=Helianthus annuus TaxID=4232 RepID=A0A251VC75_HELAN|nr:hypothetical protein HanXRQr2_Chr03g0134381 [Helianthus annuus]